MTEIPTDELIAQVKALDAAATKGPWYVDDVFWTIRPGPLEDGSYPHISLARLASTPEDGQLIAQYRTLAPELARRLADVTTRLDQSQLVRSILRVEIENRDAHLAAKEAALEEALAEIARLRRFVPERTRPIRHQFDEDYDTGGPV